MMQSESTPDSISTLDEIDQDIINLLRMDGRMSFTEIGKRLKMPEATARYRVQLVAAKPPQRKAWVLDRTWKVTLICPRFAGADERFECGAPHSKRL